MGISFSVERFQDETRHPLASYLGNYARFVADDAPRIAAWFSGTAQTFPASSFARLRELTDESRKVSDLLEGYENASPTVSDFEMFVFLQDIEQNLRTFSVIDRWLRSVRTKSGFGASSVREVNLAQNQTLAQLAQQAAYPDPENDGQFSIAYENGLYEVDYTLDSGNLLQLSGRQGQRLFVEAVVDNPQGKKILGKDVFRKMTFSDDDLLSLGPEETFIQAVEILTTWREGDHPVYPSLGLPLGFGAGASRNTIRMANVLRSLADTVSVDDTVSAFEVLGIELDGDSIRMDLEFTSVLSHEKTTKSIST